MKKKENSASSANNWFFDNAPARIFLIGCVRWRHEVFFRIVSQPISDVTNAYQRAVLSLFSWHSLAAARFSNWAKNTTQRDVCIKAMWWWRILFCYKQTFRQWRSFEKWKIFYFICSTEKKNIAKNKFGKKFLVPWKLEKGSKLIKQVPWQRSSN